MFRFKIFDFQENFLPVESPFGSTSIAWEISKIPLRLRRTLTFIFDGVPLGWA